MDIGNGAVGAGAGFLSGLISGLMGALGLKSKVNNIAKNVIYKDTFEQFEKRFDTVCQQITEMDKKIDRLLFNNKWDGLERRT